MNRPHVPPSAARATRAALALVLAAVLGAAGGCSSGDPAQTPSEVVEAFHAALESGRAADALSLLARDAVVLEEGSIDRSRDEYAAVHLPSDLEFSARIVRTLTSRRTGGTGDERWVLSVYRLRGRRADDKLDVPVAETMVLRRSDRRWRIVHIHWSAP